MKAGEHKTVKRSNERGRGKQGVEGEGQTATTLINTQGDRTKEEMEKGVRQGFQGGSRERMKGREGYKGVDEKGGYDAKKG